MLWGISDPFPPAINKLHPGRAEHDQKARQHEHVPPQAGDALGPWLHGRADQEHAPYGWSCLFLQVNVLLDLCMYDMGNEGFQKNSRHQLAPIR